MKNFLANTLKIKNTLKLTVTALNLLQLQNGLSRKRDKPF